METPSWAPPTSRPLISIFPLNLPPSCEITSCPHISSHPMLTTDETRGPDPGFQFPDAAQYMSKPKLIVPHPQISPLHLSRLETLASHLLLSLA